MLGDLPKITTQAAAEYARGSKRPGFADVLRVAIRPPQTIGHGRTEARGGGQSRQQYRFLAEAVSSLGIGSRKIWPGESQQAAGGDDLTRAPGA